MPVEVTDDLKLCHPLPCATTHILPCPLVVAETYKDNAIECGRQRARWKAVQEAKRHGLSLRTIDRPCPNTWMPSALLWTAAG